MSSRDRQRRIPILMYHELIDEPLSADALFSRMQRSYFVKKSAFEQQLNFLHENGFSTISLKDLIGYFRDPSATAIPEKSILITFDDGYAGNYQFALPLLKKYGFKATFFITVGSVGKPFMMDWQQLKSMSDEGMSIQSHTLTHPFLKQLEDSEIRKELRESKAVLEHKLNSKVEFISLPHGSYGHGYRRIAEEEGYMGGCGSRAGTNCADSDVYLLSRIHVSGTYGLAEFSKIASGDRHFIRGLAIKKNVKSCIRDLIGEKAYVAIYNMIFGLKKQP